MTATNFNFISSMKLKIIKGGSKPPSTCMQRKNCTLKGLHSSEMQIITGEMQI